MLNRLNLGLLATLLTCAGCGPKGPAPVPAAAVHVRADSSQATAAHKVYVCPMHSDTTYDHPGNCARCGMQLVEKS